MTNATMNHDLSLSGAPMLKHPSTSSRKRQKKAAIEDDNVQVPPVNTAQHAIYVRQRHDTTTVSIVLVID
jgi:hypothetical protein